MSDEASNNEILLKIGELRGEIRGHEKRLDQQHADILRLSGELADHKATFLKCFADAEDRNGKSLDRAVAHLTELFSSKVEMAAQKAAEIAVAHIAHEKTMPVKEFIQDRPYTAVGISGVVVAIMNWFATQAGIFAH